MITTVKEHPILFSAPMVRALLDGSKTQTRRPYKARRHPDTGCEIAASELVREQQHVVDRICPYGQPGDRLWVRETWAQPAALDPGPTVYRADYPACVPAHFTNLPSVDEITWKPSIHMFRRDSRILLEIVAVRVERLNDCSEADAAAEGWTRRADVSNDPQVHADAARDWYRDLWESINGASSWTANPWVWVIEFKRIYEGGRKTNADDN
jgi:hypothetical protein